MTRDAWGLGLTTQTNDGRTLDAWFPALGWDAPGPDDEAAVAPLMSGHGDSERIDEDRQVVVRPISLSIDVDAEPQSAADVYLRLHLISARLARPRSINLDGAFALLHNVAWTAWPCSSPVSTPSKK